MHSASVTVEIEQVSLLSVVGRLNAAGLRHLQARLDALLDSGVRLLVADLSGVADCDEWLFAVLARTNDLLVDRGGWLHLVGLSPPVLDALERAALPEVLLVYRASDWTSRAVR